MTKQIVIAALNITTTFEATAGATFRKLKDLGCTIGLSSVKLLQNGTKTEVAGVKVVEVVEEKKERKARTSKVFEQFVTEFPSLALLVEKNFTPCFMENKHHQRVSFKRDAEKHTMNIGKRGVHVTTHATQESEAVKRTFGSVEAAVKFLTESNV